MDHRSPSLENSHERFAGNGFFYSNLRIQEVLTTIRYGIEARKGLMILTGGSGTGKTTQLGRVTTEVAVNVNCILESDPRVSFSDILRMILRKLNCEVSDCDEPTLVRACRNELLSRLERRQIVALLLDNAHHLPDQTIRHLMQNFVAKPDEDSNRPLLQLVLAGRPELKAKLSHAALIPLRRRLPIVCELEGLSCAEISDYIRERLKSNSRQPDLFDERAVKRMALFTDGNPRALNALCDRAVQITGGSGVVTPELVEGAARDLGFHPSERNDKPQQDEFERRPIVVRPAEFDFGEVAGTTNPIFPMRDNESTDDFLGALPARRRTSTWLALLTVLIALGGLALAVPSGTAMSFLRDWNARFKQIAAPLLRQEATPSAQPKTGVGIVANSDAPIRVSGPDYPIVTQENSKPRVSEPDRSDTAGSEAAHIVKAPPKNLAKVKPDIVAKQSQEHRLPAKENPASANQDLQSQIAKAIESRAILGVEVSVVRGTAFLDGHVASERQRRAAERAARGVAGVQRVQNRLAVTLG